MGGFANGGEGRVDDVVRGRGFAAEGVAETVETFLQIVIAQRRVFGGERVGLRGGIEEGLETSAAPLITTDAPVHRRIETLERSLRNAMGSAPVISGRREHGLGG